MSQFPRGLLIGLQGLEKLWCPSRLPSKTLDLYTRSRIYVRQLHALEAPLIRLTACQPSSRSRNVAYCPDSDQRHLPGFFRVCQAHKYSSSRQCTMQRGLGSAEDFVPNPMHYRLVPDILCGRPPLDGNVRMVVLVQGSGRVAIKRDPPFALRQVSREICPTLTKQLCTGIPGAGTLCTCRPYHLPLSLLKRTLHTRKVRRRLGH